MCVCVETGVLTQLKERSKGVSHQRGNEETRGDKTHGGGGVGGGVESNMQFWEARPFYNALQAVSIFAQPRPTQPI